MTDIAACQVQLHRDRSKIRLWVLVRWASTSGGTILAHDYMIIIRELKDAGKVVLVDPATEFSWKFHKWEGLHRDGLICN